MKKILLLACLVALLIPVTSAMAEETGAYITGPWRLDDGGRAGDSYHSIMNPTNVTLYVDTAWYDKHGDFCGCDTWDIPANGEVHFWDSDEYNYDYLDCWEGKGQLKVIAFQSFSTSTSFANFVTGAATVTGFTSVFFGDGSILLSGGMKAVVLNTSTTADMKKIHLDCVNFFNSNLQSANKPYVVK